MQLHYANNKWLDAVIRRNVYKLVRTDATKCTHASAATTKRNEHKDN